MLSTEIDRVQEPQAALAAPRLDLYQGIHKAMRAFMADTLLAVGRMDADDALELAQCQSKRGRKGKALSLSFVPAGFVPASGNG